MKPVERPSILCVDDEPALLQALALHLGRRYEVLSAAGGAEALAVLQRTPAIAVIISDMRMPGLNGAEFLAQARVLAPAAERIMLTGQSDLASAIAAVNEGQVFRFLTKPCAPPDLLGAVEAAVERNRARSAEQAEIRLKVELQQLQVDPGTGLASRLQVLGTVEAAAFDAAESAVDLVAYYIDCDRSDEAANALDRVCGDELPRVMAARLKRCCSDAVVIARWGVEQFVIVVRSQGASDDELRARGFNLQGELSRPIMVDQDRVHVDVSIGIARLVDRSRWQDLFATAGLAAREARRTGGLQVCLYRPDVQLELGIEREMLRGLRGELDHEGLHLHYQPIVEADSGRVRGLECLARWNHRTLGSIGPAKFIPLAERSGDIVGLGQWVLWRACHEGRSLVDGGRLGLSVNVSTMQFIDASFLPHLLECLTHSGLPPEALTLELTESALAGDLQQLRTVLEHVRSLGVRIAVDDFGTGYSSLSHVGRLPIDVIKIDRAFVRDFDLGGRTIIRATLAIARELGREVIVEGVETAEMLQQVRRLGASLIQGYWFARPMPPGEVLAWLRAFEGGPAGADAASPDLAATGSWVR
jgi:predicted signal transduction protein with EAL and GGDEF domain